MKLIVGFPCKDRAWILPQWFEAIESQGVECEVVCLYTHSVDDTELILKEHNATILYDDQPGRKLNEIDSHCWGVPATYEYMSILRNRLLDYAIDSGADYFFSLDSDIIIPPNTISQLLLFSRNHAGIISPALNMSPGSKAWNTMQWTQQHGIATRSIGDITNEQVDVVMAAMLLDQYGMQCRWKAHPQGEDVGFSLDAYEKQIPCWWLSNLVCEHRMRRC